MTSTLSGATSYRLRVEPGAQNGLTPVSAVMTDELTAVPRSRLRETIGRLDAEQTRALERAMLAVLGIGQRLPARGGDPT